MLSKKNNQMEEKIKDVDLVKDFIENKNQSKLSILKYGSLDHFFKQKENLLTNKPDFVLTEYFPEEKILTYDKEFYEILINKGIIKLNNYPISETIISTIRLNHTFINILEKETQCNLTKFSSLDDFECLNCKILIIDEDSFYSKQNIVRKLNIRTTIIYIGSFIPKKLLIYKSFKNLLHIVPNNNKDFSIRKIVTFALNNLEDNVTYVSKFRENISYISFRDYGFLVKNNEHEYKLNFIRDKLSNYSPDSILIICNLITDNNNIPFFKFLLTNDTVKTKKGIYNYWISLIILKEIFNDEKYSCYDTKIIYQNLKFILTDLEDQDWVLESFRQGNLPSFTGAPDLYSRLDHKQLPQSLLESLISSFRSKICNWNDYSLIFLSHDGNFDQYPEEEIASSERIFLHFLHFKSPSKYKSPAFINLESAYDIIKDCDPISYCILFVRYLFIRESHSKNFTFKQTEIVDFLFSDNPAKYNDFVLSLFIFFAELLDSIFWKKQILFIIENINHNKIRVLYFTNILKNYKPIDIS
jgi:hypothetical protein